MVVLYRKEKLGERKGSPWARQVQGRGGGGKSREEPQVLSKPGGHRLLTCANRHLH